MDTPSDVAGVTDPLLRPFLEADETTSAARLADLSSAVVEPVARRVCRARLRGDEARDAEDVASGVILTVLTRLRAMRLEPSALPIGDFAAYVAGAAANGCRDHLRARHPERFKLKSRIRYVLQHQPGFAAWKADGGTWCGFAAWSDSARRAPPAALDRLRQDAQRAAGPLPDLIARAFDRLGGPVELDDLVDAIARWLGIEDVHLVELDDARELRASAEPDPSLALDQQGGLRRVWAEIVALPPRQRAALLLNLRDGDGRDATDLFPLSGVVSLHEIAASLDLAPERFAALWPRLPLADAEIAQLLGLERQQVINLRKCARERLARRLVSPPR